MIFEICVIALLGAMLVAICSLFAKARELCEYSLRIAYGLTSLSDSLILSRCALENIDSKLDALNTEKGAEENPDDPDDEAERSEQAKAAERAFSEGVLNILNYSLGAEEAKH